MSKKACDNVRKQSKAKDMLYKETGQLGKEAAGYQSILKPVIKTAKMPKKGLTYADKMAGKKSPGSINIGNIVKGVAAGGAAMGLAALAD